MRLIDADELLEAIDNQDNWLGQMELSQMANINIYSLVNTMPTVEVNGERPKGEWLEDSGNIACSHCHTIWLYRKTDFCPNCGADMRGGRE